MIYTQSRLISLFDAQKLFRDESKSTDGIPEKWTDKELKQIYIWLARKYHPDVQITGDKMKFQKVQQAFERLKANKQGYTLTEEDLYDMYSS